MEPETPEPTDAWKLNEKRRKPKSAVKKRKEALELQTKDTIENLRVEQVKELPHRSGLPRWCRNLLEPSEQCGGCADFELKRAESEI